MKPQAHGRYGRSPSPTVASQLPLAGAVAGPACVVSWKVGLALGLFVVVSCRALPAQGQLTINNLGQTNPSQVFLSNPTSSSFTTIFEGDGGATDASDGRGQSFLAPDASGSNNAWLLDAITVQAHGDGASDYPTSDVGVQLSIYQWPSNDPENTPPPAGGELQGVLLYQGVANLPAAPGLDDRLQFDLGATVLLPENAAYGFVIEFDPNSGTKDSEQLRFRVSGNSGNDFAPGDLWRTFYDVSTSQYINATAFNSQDLTFQLSGAEAAVGSTPTLLIDRETGAMTLNAAVLPTLEIIEYDIVTNDGNFNVTGWNSIESQGIDDDTWFTFQGPQDRTELAEGTLGELTLIGPTASIDFGEAWAPSPFEDVVMAMKLSNGETVNVQVAYTGNGGQAIQLGDYTGPSGKPDGVIDALDWPTVRDNLLQDVSLLSGFDRYLNGDLNRDGLVDRNDFRSFKNAFETQNGPGSFAAMLAGVPEPATSGMLVAAVFGLAAWRPVRSGRFMAALLVAGIAARVEAVVVFTETWNTTSTTAGDWVSFTSFSENRSSDMPSQEGNRSRAINNNSSNGPGYVYNNLTATQAITWQPNTRYTIDLLAGYRSPSFSGALDFGVWEGVPVSPATEVSLGNEGFVDVADADGDLTPIVPDNTFVEVASLTDPSVVQFSFETGATVPTGDLVLFLRNTRTDPMNGERVYTDNLRLNTEALDDVVTLVVDPTNGLVQLRGGTTALETIDYVQIDSVGGFLLTGEWNSLDDQGVGDLQGVPGWEEAGASNANSIAELFLRGGYDAPANTDIGDPLGAIWDFQNGPADPLTDLSFLYTLATGEEVQGFVTVGSIPLIDLPGDYNDDGTVDGADYAVWRNNLGQSVTLPNDATPGTVTQADLDVWKANFGSADAGAAQAATAAPEPQAACLLAFLLSGLSPRWAAAGSHFPAWR